MSNLELVLVEVRNVQVNIIMVIVRKFRNIIVLLIAMVLVAPDKIIAHERGIHHFVVSGVVVNSGNGKNIQGFVDYLSTQSNYQMEVVFVDSYENLSAYLRAHPDAIAWTCGAPYVEDARADGQQLISVPLFNGVPEYSSIILTKKGSSEKTLNDFKGKVFVYSDPRSNSGYISPSYSLKSQGIDIKKHFRLMIHAGSHERSIEALLGGLADVAAVDEYVWVEYVKKHPQARMKLVELERMGPFPFTPIVASAEVSKKNIVNLRKTLLGMNETEQGRGYLRKFGLDGFIQVDKDFFYPIEKMLKKVSNNN